MLQASMMSREERMHLRGRAVKMEPTQRSPSSAATRSTRSKSAGEERARGTSRVRLVREEGRDVSC